MSDEVTSLPPVLREADDVETYHLLQQLESLGGSAGFIKHLETAPVDSTTAEDSAQADGLGRTPIGEVRDVSVHLQKILGCFKITITVQAKPGEVNSETYRGYCVGFGKIPSDKVLKGRLNVKDWATLLRQKLPSVVKLWTSTAIVIEFGPEEALLETEDGADVTHAGVKLKCPLLSLCIWRKVYY